MTHRSVVQRLQRIRESARALRTTPSTRKNAVLRTLAKQINAQRLALMKANLRDLAALGADATPAFRDRLALSDRRIAQAVESLRQVASFPDPAGEIVESRTLANGLIVRRVRAPLGVILMIFESRPDVAIEAFSLAFKSGNPIVLRGGKESMRTTAALYRIINDVLREHDLPADVIWGVTDSDRAIPKLLLAEHKLIDVVVPRGGDSLIDFVVNNTRIPVIKNDRGLCHVYLHEDAPPAMAMKIVINAKTQRPDVCNAMETLLVHRRIAGRILPKLHDAMKPHGMQWIGCDETVKLLNGRANVTRATERSWDVEHLDMKMNCRVVGGIEEAIAHVERHGSRHSEAIVTRSVAIARRFQSEVDAAVVYSNASTRFTDGFALGLGGELGISTQVLHVRGPVGLRELTSTRWIIDGGRGGSVRE